MNLILYSNTAVFRLSYSTVCWEKTPPPGCPRGSSLKRCSVHFSPRRTRQPPCHMCGNGAPPCGAAERNSIAMPRRGATRSASAGASRAPHIWLAARTASSSKFRVVLATFVRESVRGVVACTPPAQLQKALYHTVTASIPYGCIMVAASITYGCRRLRASGSARRGGMRPPRSCTAAAPLTRTSRRRRRRRRFL